MRVEVSFRGRTLKGRSFIRDFLYGLRNGFESTLKKGNMTETQKSALLSICDRISDLIKRVVTQREAFEITLPMISKEIGVDFVRKDGMPFDTEVVETDPSECFEDREFQNGRLPSTEVMPFQQMAPSRRNSSSGRGVTQRRQSIYVSREEQVEQIRSINDSYRGATTPEEKENALKQARCFFLFHGVNPLREGDTSRPVPLYEDRDDDIRKERDEYLIRLYGEHAVRELYPPRGVKYSDK